MSEKVILVKDKQGEFVSFHCPGCNMMHLLPISYTPGNEIYLNGKLKPIWQFNGDLESPTLKPSFKIVWVGTKPPTCCHSIIRDGIQIFLVETTHKYSGQRVPMRDQDDYGNR